MASTEYLSKTYGLTRTIRKILVSVGLVSPDGPAPERQLEINDLLAEARLRLLPFMFLWNVRLPSSVRMLALRQYCLIMAIRIGLAAVPFAQLFGMAWVSMQILQVIDPRYMDLSMGVDMLAAAIALGGLKFFSKVVLLCMALMILSQPMRQAKWADNDMAEKERELS